MKAVIVDIQGRYAAALLENGEVRRIARDNYTIGQTIELYNTKRSDRQPALPKMIRTAASVAAALALVTGAGAAAAYAIPYGTVTVEAESNIEYTINCFDYVLDVKAGNEDGELLLSTMDLQQLRHHKIGDAVASTLAQIEKDSDPEAEKAETAIAANTKNEDHTQKLLLELKTNVSEDLDTPADEDHEGSEDTEQQEVQDKDFAQDHDTDREQDSGSVQPDDQQAEVSSSLPGETLSDNIQP